MKQFFLINLMSIFTLVQTPELAASTSPETYLIQNMADKPEIPRNFRTTLDPLDGMDEETPSLLGLEELNISGSGQFSQQSLEAMVQAIPHNNIVVIDLREEPHGMLNGIAITWYSHNNWTNEGMSPDEIEWDLQERVASLANNSQAEIYSSKRKEKSFSVDIQSVYTEQEAVERAGAQFFRIYARDHQRASDEAIDRFVEFVKNLDQDTWLHFHCSAGRGRTTSFMALYDMMKNASKVSVDDIVARQHLIGGLDLYEIPEPESWQHSHNTARAQMIRDFHRYCLENPDFSVPWSEWLKNQSTNNSEPPSE